MPIKFCHQSFSINSIYYLQLPILYDVYIKTISNRNSKDFICWLSVREMLQRWQCQSHVRYPKALGKKKIHKYPKLYHLTL